MGPQGQRGEKVIKDKPSLQLSKSHELGKMKQILASRISQKNKELLKRW